MCTTTDRISGYNDGHVRHVDRELFRTMIHSIYRILEGRITGEDVYQIGKNTGLALTSDLKYTLNFVGAIEYLADVATGFGLGEVMLDRISDKREMAGITLSNCIICSDLDRKQNVCHFPSGLFAGLIQGITGGYVISTEVECMANGFDNCRFVLMRKTIF